MKRLIFMCALLSALLPAAAQPRFGADLSTLPRAESAGAVFREAGVARDPLQLLRDNHVSLIRLRLWHTPAEPWQGLDSVIAFASRLSAQGFDLLLDLHYSDTWADPEHQLAPAAWSGLSFETLRDFVYAYTTAVLRRFDQAGARPALVQVGNEIDAGLLWPQGHLESWSDAAQWLRILQLLSAGLSAVRNAFPGQTPPLTLLHLSRGGDDSFCRAYLDLLLLRGIVFDAVGLSYYPIWHGNIGGLEQNLHALAARYNRDVYVLETAYPFTLDAQDSTHNVWGDPGQLLPGYSATPQGQRDFLRDVTSAVASVPGARGKAVLYWEPCWISAPSFGSPWENAALFDFSGNALPALNVVLPAPGRAASQIPQLSVGIAPNPFNARAQLFYELPQPAWTTVDLFDLLGRHVLRVVAGFQIAGRHSQIIDGAAIGSGTYWMRVRSAHRTACCRAVILK